MTMVEPHRFGPFCQVGGTDRAVRKGTGRTTGVASRSVDTMTLLHAIETCLRRTDLPPSRFGRNAVRDPRLVHDLRRGRQPGASLDRRVRAYIATLLDDHAGHQQKTERR